MATNIVKYNIKEKDIALFANDVSFIVGLGTERINRAKTITFKEHTIRAGTIFSSIGEPSAPNLKHMLVSKEGIFYKVEGVIENLEVADGHKISLLVFSAFDSKGTVELSEYAKQHDYEQTYMALTINGEQAFSFTNVNGQEVSYTDNIALPDSETVIILDEED